MSDTSPLSIPAAGESPAADPFHALLTDCESADTSLSTSVPALASLTADLAARSNESVQQATAQVASFRSALLARKTQVLDSAQQLLRKQRKRIVADFEETDVSTEQLLVWAVVTGTGTACPDHASPLLASPCKLQNPAVGVDSILEIAFVCELGSVATGDGLRVVSAAGPGLKWFEPHSRNEFSVVLAQADGSVPVWLTAGDVMVEVISSGGTAGAARVGAAAVLRTGWERQGTVSVLYGGLSEDALEVELQLSVCGAILAAAAVAAAEGTWRVRVPRKPLAGHECAAVGTHIRALAVVEGCKFGMAVSADEKWLVVGLVGECTLSVYSLTGGELVRTFGGRGDGMLQFRGMGRLCFAPNCNVIVADDGKQRLQEVTLEGVFVRFIGVGEFDDCQPFCVAVHDDVIAVGCGEGSGPRVVLFDFANGAVTSHFGVVGNAPGQLSADCTGIRFTPDGSHVIVAEHEPNRLSLFTTAGVFVRCVGVGLLEEGDNDVLQSVTGEYVVTDRNKHRVCVFSPDGSELVRSWGVRGTGDGQFQSPVALAALGKHLYVMDVVRGRVQVFE